jgi:hypothetical protein
MKPTANELEMAIVAAEAMRTSGTDEHHVAKTLLYLYQRLQGLEKVFAAAENYLQFGQEEPQHAELVLAIDAVRQAEQHESGEEGEDLGLG